jgi:hypothetical protein
MKSFRDPETGKPRQRLLKYLGKTATISLRTARRAGLDLEELQRLALAGKIEIRAPVKEIDLRLGHDGTNWTAKQAGPNQDGDDGLAFAAPTLLALVATLKRHAHAVEERDPEDAEVRVQVRLEADEQLPIDALMELRRSLYALSQAPLTLLLPPQEPLPRILNAKEAITYLKKHGTTMTVEALYEAVHRGRLGCLYGSLREGMFRPLIVPHGGQAPWERPKGTKRWAGLVFLETDLDHYAAEKGLPEKSVITLIQKRIEGKHAAGGEAQRRPNSGGT